jgi:hypothetical protein
MDTTTIAETMERGIARLKVARPRLTSRIERAEHILVTQLHHERQPPGEGSRSCGRLPLVRGPLRLEALPELSGGPGGLEL